MGTECTDYKKQCKVCRQTLQASSFSKESRNKDGLMGKCKRCRLAKEREYLKTENGVRSRKLALENYKNSGKQKLATTKYWSSVRGQEMKMLGHVRDKLSGKERTRRLTQYYIYSGKLKRQPCERCGSSDNIQAHHEDYSKPRDVMWLCPIHHAERHKEMRNAAS
jgi:hypothetical protein